MWILAYVHQLAWSALFGMQVFQVSYRNLPQRQFIKLQRVSFPIYFNLQTGLLALTIATAPVTSLLSVSTLWTKTVPLGLASVCAVLNTFVYGPRTSTEMDLAFSGEPSNNNKASNEPPKPLEKSETVPQKSEPSISLSQSPPMSYSNLSTDSREPTEEPQKVTRAQRVKPFKFTHSMSLHLNLISVICTAWYSLGLVARA